MNGQERCGSCRYLDIQHGNVAVCRRYPPAAGPGWARPAAPLPTVDPDKDWCGEYQSGTDADKG